MRCASHFATLYVTLKVTLGVTFDYKFDSLDESGPSCSHTMWVGQIGEVTLEMSLLGPLTL